MDNGRVTLLGDAAHPMYSRDERAAQAILDASALADALPATATARSALKALQNRRLPATAAVVLTSRPNPPDEIFREVYRRTGDEPHGIDDVISREELAALSESYKRVAGYDKNSLRPR